MLIAAYNNKTDSPLSGFNGEIYLIRGASSTVLTSVKITVNCMAARQDVKFYAEINGTQKKCGKCTYNGVNYIGVEIGQSSSSNIFISGIYSKDCIFKAVNINDVQWEA